MNKEKEIIRIIDFIYVHDDEAGCKELHRRVVYDQIGEIGETYYNEQWHEFPQLNSYYPDPTPGVFIDEEKAKEIMKIIDKEDS
ncbi:hypothetical protein [Chryseobacterium jejuense]|uniref:Uncharacterized protein n=1 Tax=Chryseobacterium jejuense TaxID=445960 RepID=A0A2X2XPW9_CHRJE|nr:hypothetical protein [Chryseobacterium jejuense]SDJ08953.1 hypothetical protein SAMN05421542_2601 [Chryseobacterium jejuense]SQB27839.1 Uncharacterised protein [Chryseobacterium jejuense]